MLPNMDQAALYKKYDSNYPASWSYVYGAYSNPTHQCRPTGVAASNGLANINAPVIKTPLQVLLCPTDGNDLFYQSTNQYYSISDTITGGARTNYDFNVWYGEYYYQGYAFSQLASDQRAIFASNSKTNIASIQDGTTNTVAISETIREVWNGVPPAWGHAGHVQDGIDLSRYPINTWQYGPNNPAYAYMKKIGRLAEWGTAGSLHAGGAQFLMSDGAVRFITESIDTTVKSRLHTMADRKPVGNF